MIQLAGKKIGEDVENIYTGLRPGEKLHEQEQLVNTTHDKILKAQHRKISWEALMDHFDALQQACTDCDEQKLLDLLKQLVPEYQAVSADAADSQLHCSSQN